VIAIAHYRAGVGNPAVEHLDVGHTGRLRTGERLRIALRRAPHGAAGRRRLVPVARLVRVEGELPPAPSTETWFGGSG
jgi:hypothetical protein